MAYCAQADIEVMVSPQSLQKLTDDLGDGVTDEDKLAAIIAQVDAVIDGYLRGIYTVPLAVTPVEIMGLSRDLVIYELYRRRGVVPEQYVTAKTDADRRLRDIKNGLLVLNVAPPDAHQSVPILVDKEESDRVFPNELLDRF